MRQTVVGYECFGDAEKAGRLDRCGACQYSGSCRVFAETPDNRVESRLPRTVSVEAAGDRAEFARDGDDEERGSRDIRRRGFGWEDMRHVMQWLLSMDDFTLDILSRLAGGGIDSASDLARAMGVRRQAVHRKLVDMCAEHPELCDMLRGYLPKCRRIAEHRRSGRNRQHFRRRPDDGGRQMEFDFDSATQKRG